MSTATENFHLERLRKDNLESFKWVYLKYHARVYYFCCHLIGDELAAEEITEDVFVRLWVKRANIDSRLGCSGLLFKITRDLSWNYLKRSSRKRTLQARFLEHKQQVVTAPGIESKLVLEDYLSIAEKGMQLLPEKCREAFILRYKNGLDNGEIAHRLSISEVTVRVHLSKAAKLLRNYLESHPEIPLGLFFLIL